MEALEILRLLFGFALVLFIPGFAFTLALWPKTKKEVYREIVNIIKVNAIKRNVSDVCIAGEEESAEELLQFLRENLIQAEICGNDFRAGVIILADKVENRSIAVQDRLIIDLANNDVAAVKIEDTVDGIERIALSIGLSIAIVPLLGIALDKTGFGLRLSSILPSLLLSIALFLGIYYWRRKWITSKSSLSA